jgi:serine phosphatase RsbU (regulator of sigma subunit)
VEWSARARHVLPLAVLVLFGALDIAIGRDQQVLSLTVISPLVAASLVGRRATAAYGLGALVVSALLGVYDHQYTAAAAPSQVIRLFGVALGGALAVATCTLRLRSEAELTRATQRAAEDRAAVTLARTLQRHLLGDLPAVAGLETAVRYLPATRNAQVGGDWYDAFPLPDGTTMLVIGDVAGHDAPAAATMSQVRGMLRAIAQGVVGSPAAVLATLDTTLANLRMPTLVTATVATIDTRGTGPTTLRWSNAGHPAAVLVCADGGTVLLDRTPDRLLGVSSGGERHDHATALRPGDTVVFFTDGLVERRGMSLDEGMASVVRDLQRIGREPLDALCDGLLAGIRDPVEDDVALLAVRVPTGPITQP